MSASALHGTTLGPAHMPAERRASPACLEALRALLGDRLSTNAAIRERHGHDESYHQGFPPDAVAFVTSTQEAAAVVRLCAEHGTPVIPYGTGTSLEGHVAALAGGISLDVSGMNQVLEVRPQDMDVTVQAGVTRKQLNDYIRDTGLFFPIDPGADASLGGMTATRASGTNAVRYGTMRDNVLALTVVLADGQIIRTGGRARKSSAGYDLTRLFVGSEGTLGVITEVTLRLHGIPDSIMAAACSFASVDAAVRSVMETIQAGVPVARIEFVDEVQMRAMNAYSKLDYPETPHLFYEFHGSAAGVREQVEMAEAIAGEHGGSGFQWAENAEERARLWDARHKAYYAALALRPSGTGFSSDVCVPISRLAECIVETRRDIDASPLTCTIVGHVGDGNFHVLFLVDPNQPGEMAEAVRINDRLIERALSMDGTCTGEHGIGYGKMAFLEAEHGPAVEVMRAIKRALDPANLMNPGKVFVL